MAIAFPFIEVTIDPSALLPVQQRAPGVLAVVGAAPNSAASVDVPEVVGGVDAINTRFRNGVNETDLSRALKLAVLQDPHPTKIYGVKLGTAANAWESALASLEGIDDVTFVALAGAKVEIGSQNAPIVALKAHCELQSAGGNKRIGVAHIDPGIAKSANYAADIIAAATALKSSSGRMVMVAARGAKDDAFPVEAEVAAASAAAIAALPVATSIVLKKVRGISLPQASQYSPAEISALADDGIVPIIDPSLIAGTSLHFSEGTTYSTDATLKYVDIVRLLDDVEFRLKAGLIGMIGDARITRGGLADIISRCEGVLGVVQFEGGINGFSVSIPVYDALCVAETARSPVQVSMINTARAERLVDLRISVVIGPAVHHLRITLQPRF